MRLTSPPKHSTWKYLFDEATRMDSVDPWQNQTQETVWRINFVKQENTIMTFPEAQTHFCGDDGQMAGGTARSLDPESIRKSQWNCIMDFLICLVWWAWRVWLVFAVSPVVVTDAVDPGAGVGCKRLTLQLLAADHTAETGRVVRPPTSLQDLMIQHKPVYTVVSLIYMLIQILTKSVTVHPQVLHTSGDGWTPENCDKCRLTWRKCFENTFMKYLITFEDHKLTKKSSSQ